MTPAKFVTRFAPSPTGYLHRGHAFSALTAFAASRRTGGDFLLRIEDIDVGRCQPQFEAAIYQDLDWLGLRWPTPVRRQSDHLDRYQDALAALRLRGLLYRCFRTRAELAGEIGRAPQGPERPWRGAPLPASEESRLLDLGRPFAWRLSIDAALQALADSEPLSFVEEPEEGPAVTVVSRPQTGGDVILARKDLGVAYHLAVVVDDAAQGVTHVIRGADLAASCHVQRLLQALLGLPSPRYRHHRLVLRTDGKRFAKRDTAETLRDLRARGMSPEALIAQLEIAPS